MPVLEEVLDAGMNPQEVLDVAVGPPYPLDGPGFELCPRLPAEEGVDRRATDADHEAMVWLAIDAGADPNGRPIAESPPVASREDVAARSPEERGEESQKGTPLPAETARRLGHRELAEHLDLLALLATTADTPEAGQPPG